MLIHKDQAIISIWWLIYNAVLSHSVMSHSLWSHGLHLPGSSVLGASPGKKLEWDASMGSSQHRDWTQVPPHCKHIIDWSTRETQESWSGQLNSSLGDIPDLEIELGSPAWQADSLPAQLPGKPIIYNVHYVSAWQLFRSLLFNSQIVMFF